MGTAVNCCPPSSSRYGQPGCGLHPEWPSQPRSWLLVPSGRFSQGSGFAIGQIALRRPAGLVRVKNVQEFSTPRIGTIFQERSGKLFTFEVSSVSVMTAWPKPLAWRKTRQRSWYHYRPKIGIPAGPLDSLVWARTAPPVVEGETEPPPIMEPYPPLDLAWRHWCDRIPVEIRNAIAPFHSRH
jgi:hypothetical protein